MKVQRLLLRDVRSIKSLDLDFRDPVTGKPLSRVVLAGANGSGKTTILECVFALLKALEPYGMGDNSPYDKLQGIEFDLSDDSQMQIVFEISLPGEPLAVLSAYYGASKPILEDTLVPGAARIGGKPGRYRGPRYALPEMSPFRKLATSIRKFDGGTVHAAGSILYYPHNRSLPAPKKGELELEPSMHEWAYRYKASDTWRGSTESYLFSLNYLDLEDRDRRAQTPANRFERAVELVNSVLDGKRIARIERGRVVVETADGQTHGLGDLSSGEKQLVLLLIEIHRRIVPGSVILIDEPEISLHPTWQRSLVAALDKIIEQYDAQVILATHSLEIATAVKPHEVVNLSDLDDLPRGEWKPEAELAA